METRYRACELLGAEASVEIQSAARRVAEENESLRTLLQAKGVGDEEINAHLLNSMSPDLFPSATYLLAGSKACSGGWDQPSDASFVSAGGTPWPVDYRRIGSLEVEDQGTSTSRTATILTSHLSEEQIAEQDILANTFAPGGLFFSEAIGEAHLAVHDSNRF